jgi:hypothetical protein
VVVDLNRKRLALGGACLLFFATLGTATSREPSKMRFAAPIRLTPASCCGGYEPSVFVDQEGGLWITAHKGNAALLLSESRNSTHGARAASWLWWSPDGKHFEEPPGEGIATVKDASYLMFGVEADIATGDHGWVYFVDTTLADATISRWTVSKADGTPSFDFFRAAIPGLEPFDDRPWVVAGSKDDVLFMGMAGEQHAYPGGNGSQGASIVHMSHDGGQTFDPVGVGLEGSGWCRPAADRTSGSRLFYAICTSTTFVDRLDDTLWSFVSMDGGRTWNRYEMGRLPFDLDNPTWWPSVAVGGDGSVYATFTQRPPDGPTRLWLYRSADEGRHWERRIVPLPLSPSTWVLPSITVNDRGRMALCSLDDGALYAARFSWDRPIDFTKVDTADVRPSAAGDFVQCALGPDDKLNIVWTSNRSGIVVDSDVYFSRQL